MNPKIQTQLAASRERHSLPEEKRGKIYFKAQYPPHPEQIKKITGKFSRLSLNEEYTETCLVALFYCIRN